MNVEPIIGLEVHVELATKSKMFCGCSADYFGSSPNTHTCPVCLGLPGALPVPNRQAVEWCLKLGLALGCQVNQNSFFERKNYFYPDLPKGYQISQYSRPLCVGGSLVILGTVRGLAERTPESDPGRAALARMTSLEGAQTRAKRAQNDGIDRLLLLQRAQDRNDERKEKTIRINRVHMEEDTGKLLHSDQIPNYSGPEGVSLVDFNRSGVPLVEIVTEPDFSSTDEVVEYLKKLQLIIRYLGISDADMEEGSMRLEPTINLRVKIQNSNIKNQNEGSSESVFYTPLVEIKNINSFKFVKHALEYEIKRQKEEFELTHEEKKAGNKTTVGFSEAKRMTVLQRSKEEANDYRYFPEPDIPPFAFAEDQIAKIKDQIGELPDKKVSRYVKEWEVKEQDAQIIVANLTLMEMFEEAAKEALKSNLPVSKLANLIVNKKVQVGGKTASQVVEQALSFSQKPTLNEQQVQEICGKIISENHKAVAEYKAGKEQGLKFLVGLVMKETKGSADAVLAKSILEELLK